MDAGIGETALLETILASDAALAGSAGAATGIGSLAGTGLLTGLTGAGAAGAGLAGAEGAGGLASLTPMLEGEFGTAALNPAVAAQTAQAANVAGQAVPSAFEAGSNFYQPGLGQGNNIAQMMGNSGVQVAGAPGTEATGLDAAANAAAPAVPAAPGAEAFTGRTMTGLPTVPGEGVTEPGFLDKIGEAWNKLPTAAQYGLGAIGAVKGLNYLEGNKYGTPATEKYEGPLSKFKYDPSKYSPLVAQPRRMAGGGLSDLGGYSDGGRMLKGPGDGMSDSIPASIAGKQPARLANDEFVIPADVVSHLGNGSSDAGAKQLYRMMDKVRAARTGKKSQAKQINPDKYMPA
jgi:hypothetical protein